MAYNSSYTGTQIDTAIGAVQTAANAGGIVNTNGLTSILGNYLTSSNAASTYQPIIAAGTTGQFYRGDKTWSNNLASDLTVQGSLYLTRTTDAEASTDNRPALLIGPYDGAHLEFDVNEIMAKGSATTTSTLHLNANGGSISFGGSITAKSTITASDTIYAPNFGTDSGMTIHPSNSNEVNFGGTNNSGTIYFGYRAWGSKPIPTQYIFSGSNGTATCKASSWATGSSRKIKENIVPISNEEAKKILLITIVGFDYKEGYGGKNKFGVIAEDIQPIIPSVVDDIDPELLGVDYSKFTPYIIKLLQIQNQEIEDLKSHIKSLENKQNTSTI